MYNLKIIQCGNRIEVYKMYNYVINEPGVKDVIEEVEENEVAGDKKSKKQNRIDNLNISRNKIVRLIKSNMDMTTFITLTFATESNYKDSKKYLNNLFNKLRRNYKDLKYLWVLEYGDINNRLHYHLLCNIPISIKLSTSKQKKSLDHKALENNFSKKYWPYGWVDIRSLHQEGNTNIALYVSSYIVKSMQDVNLDGFRIFGYSNKTLNKPVEVKVMDNRGIEDILREYQSLGYVVRYTNSYDIGYTKDGIDHKGKVSYFDMEG